MKANRVLVIAATLVSISVFYSSSSLSQATASHRATAEFIQPLMDCLNGVLLSEKAKAESSKRAIEDSCAVHEQALSALPPDVKASIMSQIDSGLDKHLREAAQNKDKAPPSD